MAASKQTIGNLLSPQDKLKKERRDKKLDEINCEFTNKPLKELESIKIQFQKYDRDFSGDLDEFEVKLLLEDSGKAVTHQKLLDMIAEVDEDRSGTISYREFVKMQGGKSELAQSIASYVSSGLKDRVSMFTPKGNEEEIARRKIEQEQQKKREAEEKKKKEQASKNRLKERAAMFQ